MLARQLLEGSFFLDVVCYHRQIGLSHADSVLDQPLEQLSNAERIRIVCVHCGKNPLHQYLARRHILDTFLRARLRFQKHHCPDELRR